MHTKRFKTLYSILIVGGLVLAGYTLTSAFDIPLTGAPYIKGTTIRGQSKPGQLTIGSSTLGTSQLTVKGASGLRIEKVDCAAAPYSAPLSWPCPTTIALGPELHALQLGYTYKMVVGAPVGTAPTTGTMLDVVGEIAADPIQMNYAGGTFYTSSSTRKPLCALPNGEIAVCGTAGICGADDGTSITTTPTRLCDRGDASSITTTPESYSWTCRVASNTPVSCSASRSLSSSGGGGGGISAPGGLGR